MDGGCGSPHQKEGEDMKLKSIFHFITQMLNLVNNRDGLEAYWRDYTYSIIFIILSPLVILFLYLYGESSSAIFANGIGLIALIIAIISLESSALKLKDIQTDYWNVRGIDEGKKRKYHDAVQAYDAASRLDPRAIKCLINKANDLCEKGKLLCGKDDERPFIEALEVINRAILLGPKYPAKLNPDTEEESKAFQEYANALKTECDILLALADHREEYAGPRVDELRNCALKSVERAIREYPENNPQLSGAYASRGTALSKLGKHKDAVEACAWAIGLDRHEAIGWAIKGNALSAQDDYEAAINDFDKAIRLKPDSSGFWYNKGQSIRKKGDLLKKDQDYGRAIAFLHVAVHAYDKAIEYNPLNKTAWNQRGRAFEELNQCHFSEDLMSFESCVKPTNIYSNESIPWLNTDTAIYSISNYYLTEALNSYNMAIDIDPTDAKFWGNKGSALKGLGNYVEAINAYDEAIRLDPDGACYAWANKGNILISLGKYDEAIQAFDEAIRLDPKYALARHNKGVVLQLLDKHKEAEAEFAKGP